MQRAMRCYRVHTVCPTLVRQRGDGCFVVDLGNGRRELPPDPRIGELCLRMYTQMNSLSPKLVYMYASGDEFDSYANGDPFDDCPSVRCSFSHQDGDDKDPRLQMVKMEHVAPVLVQSFADFAIAPSFGYAPLSYAFESRDRALLALAVQEFHRRGTPEDVLCCLSCSFDVPQMRYAFGVLLPSLKVAESRHTDVHLVTLGTSTWHRIIASTKVHTPNASYLWAVQGDSHMALRLTFVVHHWRAIEGGLTHRVISGCSLVFHPVAMSGGILRLQYPGLNKNWPWWVDNDIKRVPVNLLCGETQLDSRIRMREEDVDIDFSNVHKRLKPVLQRWSKSSDDCKQFSPMLTKMLQIHKCDTLTSEDGQLIASRERPGITHTSSKDDCEKYEAYKVFVSEFGRSFAKDALIRAGSDDCACYFVEDKRLGRVVGAFTVFPYECILHDGTITMALMIDVFAVYKEYHGKQRKQMWTGKKYGLQMWNLLKGFIKRQTTVQYLIFAQCLRGEPAYSFWLDKLDETSIARTLMLQAYHLDHKKVDVQEAKCCTPRAREYVQ